MHFWSSNVAPSCSLSLANPRRKLPHKWENTARQLREHCSKFIARQLGEHCENIAKSACQTQALRAKNQLKKNIKQIRTFQHVRPWGNKLPHNAKGDCKSDGCRKDRFRGGLAVQCSAEVTCFLTFLHHPTAIGSAKQACLVKSTIIVCTHADVLIFALWCRLDLAFIVCC